MESTLANIYLEVAEFSQPVNPSDLADGLLSASTESTQRTVALTQSRLSIFLNDAAGGRPLVGLPVFVFVECSARYTGTSPSGDSSSTELPETLFNLRIPLGLLATDHLGYLSYDLSRLPDLIAMSDIRLKTLLADDLAQYQQAAKNPPLRVAIRAIWIHPYGDYPFDGMLPGRFSVRPDALVINALLVDNPMREEMSRAGIPSMQEPSIVDWRLSPGSFAISPRLEIGDDGCERFTPASIAINTYFFYRVVIVPEAQPPVPPPADPASRTNQKTRSADAPVRGRRIPLPPPGSPTVSPRLSVTDPVILPPRQAEGPVVKIGVLNLYRSAWYQLGHSLGKVLYSLPLAPAETSNIAVIDWMREDSAVRSESTAVSEQLIADLRRDRGIEETIDGAVAEYQNGNSFMAAGSLVAGAAGSSGSMGGMAGLGVSLGGGNSSSYGGRDLHESTIQNLSDRIEQSSSSVRELTSTVVVRSSQRESTTLTTRNITNYNHSHTLTILYYELLRHLRVETSTEYSQDVQLIKFPDLFDSTSQDPKVLLPFLEILRGRLLLPGLTPCIDAYERLAVEVSRPAPAPNTKSDEQKRLVYQLIGSIQVFEAQQVPGGGINANGILLRVQNLTGDFISLKNATFSGMTKFQTEPYASHPAVLVEISPDPGSTYVYPFQLIFSAPQPWDGLGVLEVAGLLAQPDYNLRFSNILAQGLTDAGPIDLGSRAESVDMRRSSEDPHWTLGEPVPLTRPNIFVPPPTDPMDRLSAEDQRAIWQLFTHVKESLGYYSVLRWITNDEERIDALSTLSGFSGSFWPVTIFGRYLVFPSLSSRRMPPEEVVVEERLITLPTRGVFADAKLGTCNVSEVIDDTRFWDWQTSPIPFPAPEISGIQPSSLYQSPSGLAPTTLPNPVVQMQTVPAAPDPSTAAALKALTTPNIFRDMSAAKEVAGVISEVTKAATQVAMAAGNMLKGGTGSSPGGSPTPSGAPQSQASDGGSSGGTSTGTDSQTTPGTSSNGSSTSSGSQAMPAPKATMPPQQSRGSGTATNRRQLAVVFQVEDTLTIDTVWIEGLDASSKAATVTRDPTAEHRFIVEYSPDGVRDDTTVMVSGRLLTPYDEFIGRLHGAYAIPSGKKVSQLTSVTFKPKTKVITLTAKKDLSDQTAITTIDNWTVSGQGSGTVTAPQVEVELADIAKAKGWGAQGTLSGGVSNTTGTQTTNTKGNTVSAQEQSIRTVIDFDADMDVAQFHFL